jgi:type I restriction enzyme R subunit
MPLGIVVNENGVFRRRDLPHLDVEGKPTFITACLAGSLPAAGLKRIRNYRDGLNQRKQPDDLSDIDWEMKKHKLVFKLADSILDGESPVKHFQDGQLAEIVQKAFLHFADQRSRLFAYAIMPSHHHWVFLPIEKWSQELAKREAGKSHPKTPREVISHSVQSFTATQCNRCRGESGVFWQPETFDHYARDEAELIRIIHYIEQNPVKAGLVEKADNYRWSSACVRQELGISPGEPIPKKVA